MIDREELFKAIKKTGLDPNQKLEQILFGALRNEAIDGRLYDVLNSRLATQPPYTPESLSSISQRFGVETTIAQEMETQAYQRLMRFISKLGHISDENVNIEDLPWTGGHIGNRAKKALINYFKDAKPSSKDIYNLFLNVSLLGRKLCIRDFGYVSFNETSETFRRIGYELPIVELQ